MFNEEFHLDQPIRWGMVGGGRGSQIGYIHRNSAARDRLFILTAGAFDIDDARGREFGTNLGVSAERCYPDYITMFAEEGKRQDGINAVSIATPNGTHYKSAKQPLMPDFTWFAKNLYALQAMRRRNCRPWRKKKTESSA